MIILVWIIQVKYSRKSHTITIRCIINFLLKASQNKRIKNTNFQINSGEQPQSSSTMPLNSTSSRQQEIQNPNVFSFFQSNNDRGIVSSLSDIIQQYESQPGLLKMILLSKVEEDRRKTEEVKLRQKELDYMIANQNLKGPEDTIDNNIKQEFGKTKYKPV